MSSRFAQILDTSLITLVSVGLLWKAFGLLPGSLEIPLFAGLSFIGMLPVTWNAVRSLWQERRITVDALASIALIASLVAQEWKSAAFITLMLAAARIFGRRTESRGRHAIESLLKLKPTTVRVKRDGTLVSLGPEQVTRGDLVIVALGERVPVDGTVTDGEGSLDQSSLTGESLPVEKKEGDLVYSSTMLVAGSLVVRAERVGPDTSFEKIIRLVEESQANKQGIQTLADRFASWYIAAVLFIALLFWLVTGDRTIVLSILLVACADDLAIAVPLAFSAALAQAAREGVIVKGGHFFERLARIDTLFMDKTGTLTEGKPTVTRVFTTLDVSSREMTLLAASVLTVSEHPLAKAVVAYAATERIPLRPIADAQEQSGHGTRGRVEGQRVWCGRSTLLDPLTIGAKEASRWNAWSAEAVGSLMVVTRDGRLIGAYELADTPRPEAASAVALLRKQGIRNIVMLTGDHEKAGKAIGQAAGISEIRAGLLPEQKVEAVKEALGHGKTIAMAGDGINDAAALALSDVGIVMGKIGSDTAIEAADVALMQDHLGKLPRVIEIGQQVSRVARQNFWLWGIMNFVGFVLVFGGLQPAGAAAYNFLTDFIPIFNSLRYFRESRQ